ncbi:MAG: hypothetical protein V7K40_34110 [Nostoc sp.]|uniref:hypothetical protein n=1 Tax=Nostoc sp. TaxID=1180 RepID=UPI002FF48D0B
MFAINFEYIFDITDFWVLGVAPEEDVVLFDALKFNFPKHTQPTPTPNKIALTRFDMNLRAIRI